MYTSVKNICATALMIMACAGSASAQTQPPAFTPKKADLAINSVYPELNPVLSPDGQELYFVRANHPDNKKGVKDSQDIWYSKRQEDGSWADAVHIKELNIGQYNAVWAVTGDGSTLLIHGRYNKKGNYWKKRGFSIVTRNANGSWGVPVPVKISAYHRKNSGLFSTAYLSPDGQHLVMSYGKGFNSKKSKLFVSHKKENGNFRSPKKIHLQQAGNKVAPSLSNDGRKIYFASNVAGNYDILMAERLDEKWKKWSVPTPVKSVNTNNWESYFRTNAKGSMAWYSSRVENESPDLYFVKLFEENPYMVVSGQVLDAKTQQPVNNVYGLKLYVNDTLKDVPLKEDGTYTLKLPLGKPYSVRPELDHHTSVATTMDASTLIEYTETKQDLYLTPWSVVQVKGRLVERSTNAPLPAGTRLLVNGKAADSVSIDAAAGTYALWLPFGQNYQLQLQTSKGYTAEMLSLQLEKVKAYKVITQDLYASKRGEATILGRLVDRKTGEKFPAGVPIQVVLNDTLQLAIIDSLGTYEVKLPVGKIYTLSAKAEGYYPITEMIELEKEDKSVKVYKDLYLAPVEVGQSIRLNNVFFETGKSAMMPASFPELDRVVEFLKDNENMKIEIAGHTDSKGSAPLNTKLSSSRAAAVARYIVSKGIAQDKLTSRGYGSTKPEGDNKTEQGRSRNRRVEFIILEIKK